MSCRHTGARLYLTQYCRVHAADAFLIPGAGLVFKYYTGEGVHCREPDPAEHYVVADVGEGLFVAGDKTILVVPATAVSVPEAEVDRWV